MVDQGWAGRGPGPGLPRGRAGPPGRDHHRHHPDRARADRLTHERAYAVIDADAAHRACLLAAIDAQDRRRDTEPDDQAEGVDEVEGPSWEEQSRLHRAARAAAEAILQAGLDAQLDLLDLLGAGMGATR